MKNAKFLNIFSVIISIVGVAALLIAKYYFGIDDIKPWLIYAVVGACTFSIGEILITLLYNKDLKRFEFYKTRVDLWNAMTYRIKGVGEGAFNNLPIGIILFNDKGIVEWSNEYARNVFHNKLTNVNMANIDLDLAENLKKKNPLFTSVIYGKTFECSIIDGANILYMRDITKRVEIEEKYKNHTASIGILHIDNLSNTLNGLDAYERAECSNKLVTIISEWEEKYDILVSPSSTERYLVFLDRASLEKMMKDDFFILDAIRDYFTSKSMHITASLGIACMDQNAKEVFEFAQEQLQLAFDRGGDQIVVNVDGVVSFYGAETLSQEERTSVQVRVKTQELVDLINRYNRVIIMGHMTSDTDSFGSSIALLKIVRALKKEAYIVYEEDKVDRTVSGIMKSIEREHIAALDYFVTAKQAIKKMTNDTLLIITDCQYSSIVLEEKIYKSAKHVALIDHHRRNVKSINNYEYIYIHTSASSAVELIVEMYNYLPSEVYSNLEVSDMEATWMLMGVIVDTNNFVYRTSSATFRVLAKLQEFGASTAIANRFLRDEYPKFIKKMSVINNMEIFNREYAIAVVPDDEIVDRRFAAKVADDLVLVSGVKLGFCIGRTEKDTVSISARSLDEANAQIIMEHMGGGGHFNSAAAQVRGQSVEEVKAHLMDLILEIYQGEKETMQLILVKEVRGKGKANDIIEVPAGYGNYLLRSGLAISATPDNIHMLEQKLNAKQIELERELEEARKLRDLINSSSVTIKVKVGEQGKFYGSVTSKTIVEELANQIKINIDKRKVILEKDINALGTYKVSIHLHKDVSANLTVYVVEKD